MSRPLHPIAFAAFAAAFLAACGGGGGGGGGASGGGFTPAQSSAQYANSCAVPRPAGTYNDRQGSVLDEKRWVRAWNDETYLWYDEVVDPGPDAFPDPVSYFSVLRTTARTPSGLDKDRFHFTYDTAAWVAQSQLGVSYGYGMNVALLQPTVPRQAVVAYTDPNTPAAAQGIGRGARILRVDGVDLVNDASAGAADALNAGLFPRTAGSHTFEILDAGATVPRTVTMTSASVASVPVQNVRTLPAPRQQVGYLQFNDHIATSEEALVTAITQLQAASVTSLVIDIRYNGGGFLDIASELAYMVAGPGHTAGKTFEELRFNNKNPFGLTLAQRTTPFHTSTRFSPTPATLPTLNLNRVYLLVGGDTCSASEAIINGLRGAGVQVVLVGNTTCGKPYGFFPRDNCGTTYFTVQFEGVNDLGVGGYSDGFAPTCQVADDFDHPLGDPAEARLSVALGHIDTGVCQPAVGSSRQRALSAATGASNLRGGTLVRDPARQNRIYR